jgi:hypothetical protein
MSPEQVKGILKLASEKVPFGVYAIRKGADYYELKNSPASSKTELKQVRNKYRRAGMKVYCNGI